MEAVVICRWCNSMIDLLLGWKHKGLVIKVEIKVLDLHHYELD